MTYPGSLPPGQPYGGGQQPQQQPSYPGNGQPDYYQQQQMYYAHQQAQANAYGAGISGGVDAGGFQQQQQQPQYNYGQQQLQPQMGHNQGQWLNQKTMGVGAYSSQDAAVHQHFHPSPQAQYVDGRGWSQQQQQQQQYTYPQQQPPISRPSPQPTQQSLQSAHVAPPRTNPQSLYQQPAHQQVPQHYYANQQSPQIPNPQVPEPSPSPRQHYRPQPSEYAQHQQGGLPLQHQSHMPIQAAKHAQIQPAQASPAMGSRVVSQPHSQSPRVSQLMPQGAPQKSQSSVQGASVGSQQNFQNATQSPKAQFQPPTPQRTGPSQSQLSNVPQRQPEMRPPESHYAQFNAGPIAQLPPPQTELSTQFVNMADIQGAPTGSPVDAMRRTLPPGATQGMGVHSTISHSSVKKSSATPPVRSQTLPQKIKHSPSQPSPRTSISKSPALSSSGITSRSPAKTPRTLPANVASMTVSLGEEFISQARAAAPSIAATMQLQQVEEYQTLIATGLACFDSAIQSQQFTHRQEARVRLRYAAVLQEETENLMDAETTLSKGIILCDKHRMLDLKYVMQYMMMKVLFQRNQKAAIKALDQLIKDSTAYQHFHWIYAFRLLKATFYIESGHPSDPSALENIHAIQRLALQRDDGAVSVFASLLEALTLIKSSRGTRENIQACLAAAARHQTDSVGQVRQLEMMAHLIGLIASLHHDKHEETVEKLRIIQFEMDKTAEFTSELLLPMKKTSASTHTLAQDVTSPIRPGVAKGESDYIVMSFMSHTEITQSIMALGGLVYLHKAGSANTQPVGFWGQGLKCINHMERPKFTTPLPLTQAIRIRQRHAKGRAYLYILLGLLHTSECAWDKVKQNIKAAEDICSEGTDVEMLKPFLLYLKGAYSQGTGELGEALSYFQNEALSLQADDSAPDYAQRHLALLAIMGRIWIMQHPAHNDHRLTTELITEVDSICRESPDMEIRAAWLSILSTIITKPPQFRAQQKGNASSALNTARITQNTLGVTVALTVARELLYNNLLGEQSAKCMQAARHWAGKAANPLWQSVISGVLSELAGARGELEQAQKFAEKGTQEAKAAFARSL